jgi:hypothetical protein
MGAAAPHHNEIGASGARTRQDHRAHRAHSNNGADDSRESAGKS